MIYVLCVSIPIHMRNEYCVHLYCADLSASDSVTVHIHYSIEYMESSQHAH